MKTRFEEQGAQSAEVLADIQTACRNDARFENGRILNSICSLPHPLARRAFQLMIHTNLGDPRLFPGASELEQRVVSMIGDLLGHRGAEGNVVSGGTEANLLALLAARQRAKAKGMKHPEILAGVSCHYSIDKAASILGLAVRHVPLGPDYHVRPVDFARMVTGRTAAIVATAGDSELGLVDDIPGLAALAEQHQLYMHVDAASGGFLVPFARELGHDLPRMDFSIDAVDSVTVDPHKFGLAVIPAGCILFRSKHLQQLIHHESHYVGTPDHTTLIGTRPGAAAAAAYAVIRSLGRQGFRDLTRQYFAARSLLVTLLLERGLELLVPPELCIVAVKSNNPIKAMRLLQKKGWFVSVSKRHPAIRLVLHAHLQAPHLRKFVEDLWHIESNLPKHRRQDPQPLPRALPHAEP